MRAGRELLDCIEQFAIMSHSKVLERTFNGNISIVSQNKRNKQEKNCHMIKSVQSLSYIL